MEKLLLRCSSLGDGLHQARLGAGGFILVNHALAGCLVDCADGLDDRSLRTREIFLRDHFFGVLDESARARAMQPIKNGLARAVADTLLCRLCICHGTLQNRRKPPDH